MSRIGKKPVELPSGVSASVSGQTIEVKGPKATRSFTATDDVTITVQENNVSVEPRGKSKRARQQWGMSRTMIANMVTGVSTGFKKELEISGVGYRAQVQGNVLKLSLGYSHDVNFEIPTGVTVTAAKPTEVAVEGTDEQLVGQVAANIREWRKPEPYKGKGIKYKTSISSVKKVRRSRDPGNGKQQKNSVSEAPPARSEQTAENQHWQTPVVGSPLCEKHLGSGDRRYPRDYLGFGIHLGKGLGICRQKQRGRLRKSGLCYCRACEKSGRRRGSLRPWRPSLSWQGKGSGRCCA